MEPNRLNAIVAAEGKEYGPKGIPPTRTIRMMSPGALQTLGTPLLVGRDFTWEEIHNQRNIAVMVSESFARGEWSTVEGAIGKRVLVGTSQKWQEVIGVVADVYDDGADRSAPLIIYWPARLQDFVAGTLLRRSVNFVMRSDRTGTEGFVRETRQAVAEVMPSLPVFQIRTLREVSDQSMARTSFPLVLGIAGAMALLLGIVGIDGVLAYAVMQRQREVGMRIALGAPARLCETDVRPRRGMMLSGIGIGIGAAVAAGVARWMSSLLFGVTPVDAATLGERQCPGACGACRKLCPRQARCGRRSCTDADRAVTARRALSLFSAHSQQEDPRAGASSCGRNTLHRARSQACSGGVPPDRVRGSS